jgi:hypothetical protein
MDWWSMQTDIAILVALLLYTNEDTFNSFTRSIIRWQMAIFYAGAGIWKLTIDHSNPKLSCSSMMLVQTLCGWLPRSLLAPSLVKLVATTAPTVTAVVEIGIPVLLLCPSRFYQRCGALLAVVLHVGIMVAPLPLSIADFGAMGASRLVVAVVPQSTAVVLAEVQAYISGTSKPTGSVPVLFAAVPVRPFCAISFSLGSVLT